MKYIVQFDSGFDKKGAMVDIQIIEETPVMITFKLIDRDGALLNFEHKYGVDFFNRKYIKLDDKN